MRKNILFGNVPYLRPFVDEGVYNRDNDVKRDIELRYSKLIVESPHMVIGRSNGAWNLNESC